MRRESRCPLPFFMFFIFVNVDRCDMIWTLHWKEDERERETADAVISFLFSVRVFVRMTLALMALLYSNFYLLKQ